ncbi:glycosyltransferase family 8 protein [Metabacillus fastidiosus]|uniref:glycosyltransferase family 8 protein n=1 Tax=Metabacillus fastidiosus TaxID=1458 RepID=UPI003D2B3A15
MYIVTATSDNYAKPLGVMLNSLLENLENKDNVNIFIIESNISNNNKLKLEKIGERFNIQVKFIAIDDNLFNSFKRKFKRITKEAYYRIMIPELLSNHITKALYLDCDMIVRKDISKLWNINIDNYFLAAVEDLGILKKSIKRLSLPQGSSYFNSGLLLINLQKWRENNISTKVIQFIKNNHEIIKFMDQDPLNSILYDKWLKLEYEWNYTTGHQKKIKIDDSAIIHFTGNKKPWNSEHPYKQEYLKYLSSSAWEEGNNQS